MLHQAPEPLDRPEGMLTLMFTDIEGSTRLLAALGERYLGALDDHRRILRAAFEARAGHEVDTQGDAFFVVFASAEESLAAAVDIQRASRHNSGPLVSAGGPGEAQNLMVMGFSAPPA